MIGRSYVRAELTGADIPRTLTAINSQQIPIQHLEERGELTVSFQIARGDWNTLAALCEKRGDKLKILQKRGAYWTFLAFFHRPVLIVGILILMILTFFIPSRVFFIRVEGNRRIPTRQILEAGESCGIGFGASRREVRSERVKNALLEAIPELQWAGVNTSGCTAVISVRERSAAQLAAAPSPDSSLIASRDGFILSADITRGTPLIKPGQVVRQGQTLVSGYTDCGLLIRATGAEGEVFAQTKRDFRAVTPVQWLKRSGVPEVKRKYSVIFQKKRINLWKDSGILHTTCGRMVQEYHITLPGGFRLPVSLCVEEFSVRELCPEVLDQAGAEEALKAYAQRYLTEQMISGEIRDRAETVEKDENLFCLEGTYDCTEMIGRVSKIGEANGKRD